MARRIFQTKDNKEKGLGESVTEGGRRGGENAQASPDGVR
jgi:hypothetical protein